MKTGEKIKAVLIDDESNCLNMLEWELQNACPHVLQEKKDLKPLIFDYLCYVPKYTVLYLLLVMVCACVGFDR